MTVDELENIRASMFDLNRERLKLESYRLLLAGTGHPIKQLDVLKRLANCKERITILQIKRERILALLN